MKRLALLSIFLALPLLVAGCNKAAPLPAGALAPTDATLNEAMQACHAALTQYVVDVKAGTHVPTAEERVVVNKFIDAVNLADADYIVYHKALAANPSAPEPAVLVAAVNSVVSQLAAIEALVK